MPGDWRMLLKSRWGKVIIIGLIVLAAVFIASFLWSRWGSSKYDPGLPIEGRIDQGEDIGADGEVRGEVGDSDPPVILRQDTIDIAYEELTDDQRMDFLKKYGLREGVRVGSSGTRTSRGPTSASTVPTPNEDPVPTPTRPAATRPGDEPPVPDVRYPRRLAEERSCLEPDDHGCPREGPTSTPTVDVVAVQHGPGEKIDLVFSWLDYQPPAAKKRSFFGIEGTVDRQLGIGGSFLCLEDDEENMKCDGGVGPGGVITFKSVRVGREKPITLVITSTGGAAFDLTSQKLKGGYVSGFLGLSF